MHIREFVKRWVIRLGKGRPHLSDEVVQGFMRVLEAVRIEDMPCSQVFARLDEYVERENHGEDVARLMPLLREHLDLCYKCREEYESLMALLERPSPRSGAAS